MCSYILNFGSTNGNGSSHDAWSLHAEVNPQRCNMVIPWWTTHSIGPNIRIPRTCVSLPFMWFARTITWSIYACIGLLKNKRVIILWVVYNKGRGGTHNPSPSSPGSAETSNVIHPSGWSSVTARTSCRSPRLVPARTESAAGV